MGFETISFETSNRVSYLTFNRPKVKNAINMQMIEEVEQVIENLQKKEEADILVLTGKGDSFCAGADTTEFLSMTMEENQVFLGRFSNIVKSIEDLPLPVIGVINGFAFGGGAEIAATCDFRISSSKASFRFPGASYGLVISSSNLPAIVGISKAKELIFRSCIITAEEALRIGLVDQMVNDEDLHAFSKRVASEIQSNSMAAVKKVKETINLGIGLDISNRRELEDRANQLLVRTTNYRETFSAFVEKNKKATS